jgi:hypothetical protein
MSVLSQAAGVFIERVELMARVEARMMAAMRK